MGRPDAALGRGGITAAIALVAVSCAGGGQGAPPERATPRERAAETILMWSSRSEYEIASLDATENPEDAIPTVVTPPLEGAATLGLFDRPVWSPDGTRIAFTIEHDGDASSPFATDIVVMEADGTDPRPLTDSQLAGWPAWSSDGATVAFAQRIATEPASAEELVAATIWTIEANGGEAHELVPREAGALTADLPGSWSPDGTLLAFTRMTLEDPESLDLSFDVYVVAADGSGVRKLLENAHAPTWSPDGRHVAFVSGRDGNGELNYGDRLRVANELYVAAADGSEVRRLTTTRDVNEASPAWSPDGTRIAFTQGVQTGNAEEPSVVLIGAEGGCVTTLADGGWYANPMWHPGGGKIRFEPRCD